jgi:hypothetical protein
MVPSRQMSASEVVLWSRVLQPESGDLSPEAARSILRLELGEQDRVRMHGLVVRGQAGTLTEAEEAELEVYCRVGRLLDLMRSTARRSLSGRGVAARSTSGR